MVLGGLKVCSDTVDRCEMIAFYMEMTMKTYKANYEGFGNEYPVQVHEGLDTWHV